MTDPVEVRLPLRAPIEVAPLLAFFARRAVPGVEDVQAGTYRRSLRLPSGAGAVELKPTAGHVNARFWLDDEADLPDAIRRSRSMLDLDHDPRPVLEALGTDDLIGPLVRAAPGLRVPGTPDPHELAIRAVIGQQISVAGAAILAGRLVADHGERLLRPLGSVTHLFPAVSALAHVNPERLPMPAARRRALRSLAAALTSRELGLHDGVDADCVREQLLALPGVGPWTTEYIAMRALRDADAFLPADLGIRRALTQFAQDGSPAAAARLADRWCPYRAYAFQHLLTATIPA